jgi:competence protein ComEA
MIKFITTALLALASAATFAAVDVNKANVAELEAVKGIGPSLASRIVDARKTGPFANWADFDGRVKGVGPGNAAKLSAQGLTVGGATYTAAAEPASKPARRRAAAAKP